MSQQKMQAVLWDMIRADEYVTAFVLPEDSSLNKKNESTGLYQQIFQIHHTNKEEFKKSFSFYQSHPELMKELLDSLNIKGISDSHGQHKPFFRDSSLIKKIKTE